VQTQVLPKGQRAPALVQPICWIADWFGDGKAIRGVAWADKATQAEIDSAGSARAKVSFLIVSPVLVRGNILNRSVLIDQDGWKAPCAGQHTDKLHVGGLDVTQNLPHRS